MLARGATRGLRFLRALQQPCRGFAEVSVVPDHVETVQAPSEQQQQVRLSFSPLSTGTVLAVQPAHTFVGFLPKPSLCVQGPRC